jgi:phage terminase Nu1 subunit (DNA packaging protein)
MATQQDVSTHLDLSTRQIRNLVSEGILPASKGKGGMDVNACRISYIRYLRGVGSGQVKPSTGSDDEDQKNYTDLIEQERYRRMKRENDLEEQEVAPVSVLSDALLKAASMITPVLESLPLVVKRYWPEVTGDQITEIKKAVVECRNVIADMQLDLEE